MTQTAQGSLQTRERFLIITALVSVSALSWLYLFTYDMPMPEMGNMSQAQANWSGNYFSMMLVMWVIMMIAMMVPTAMRATMIYALMVKKFNTSLSSISPSISFISGYVVVWGGFSILATLAQWYLEEQSLLSSMMISQNTTLSGGLLIIAGLYQLSELKDICLRHCQSPAHFIARHYKKGLLGAFQIGGKHGLYCLGCCWAVMLLLFVGGVMNLLWVLLISFFILLEKAVPHNINTTKISGFLLMLSGAYVLLV